MISANRRGVAAIMSLLVALASVWCSAGSAAAGGPTSVIMVNPGTGQAAALHTSGAPYQNLVDAVQAYAPASGASDRPPGVPDCDGCEIRLTWLIHDMQIWRIDRVHVTPDDGVWLQTFADESGDQELLERPAVWHRPHDQAALLAALAAAEVAGPWPDAVQPGAPNADSDTVDQAPAGDVTRSAEVSASGSGDAGTTSLVALGSGIVGAAIGVGLAIGVGRHRRSRADRTVLTG